jgi:diadenylate cyclase
MGEDIIMSVSAEMQGNEKSVVSDLAKEAELENLKLAEGIEKIGERKKSRNGDDDKRAIKLDILKKLSSGTGFREGLNEVVKGGRGALVVVSNMNSASVFQGGFKVNCKFTSKRLTELAKMDGAIILSEDFRKILYANTLLIPNPSLSSIETGTRHQAAERTAKQIGGLVIAVSERKGEITIYYGNSRYVLQHTEDLLRRATETLQILEKQREVFDELFVNLNVLEVTNLVSINDVCTILQRLEMIKKMSDIINEYIVELGKDGIIVRMRMREITKGMDKNRSLIIRDYFLKPFKVEQFFDNLSFEGLLDLENISRTLFGDISENNISSKGYRILSKTDLSRNEIETLIRVFKNLDGILNADEKALKKVMKKTTEHFKKEINNLREQIMVGKKI